MLRLAFASSRVICASASSWVQNGHAARSQLAMQCAQTHLWQAEHFQSASATPVWHTSHLSEVDRGPKGSVMSHDTALVKTDCTCVTRSVTIEANCWTSSWIEDNMMRATSSQPLFGLVCVLAALGVGGWMHQRCCNACVASGRSPRLGESSRLTMSCALSDGADLLRPMASLTRWKRPEKALVLHRGSSPLMSCCRTSMPRASMKGSSWASKNTMVTPVAQMSTLWS
mmetsp:Transcript_13065/g.33675  ORF Transcript_13065/g.33675 Transcript_13065/m.33675 type:complete len:228 (+) Transcript_13065:316-999(+)